MPHVISLSQFSSAECQTQERAGSTFFLPGTRALLTSLSLSVVGRQEAINHATLRLRRGPRLQ